MAKPVADIVGTGRLGVQLRDDRLPAMRPPRTTKLYDRTADTVTLDEIERIVI